MKQRGILKLPTYRLIPHPENPRKDLGDLSEMTQSIRKHGVLQNLTVVPVDRDGNPADADNADKYMVIIGHRRLAAAKAAGLEDVPCRLVEGMTHEEQLLTMLEENMQRSDLTPYDQAQGFQLMLDLGQTVEDIEEKSGFSRTTIYHRLNMAKLDKDLLKEKQEDDCFQLSISDLYELEKIKDVEKRNEILKKARNSSELKYQANNIAREQEKNEKFKKITTILEGLGIKQLPKEIQSWKCDRLYSIALEDYGSVEIDVVEGEELYYEKGWDCVNVYSPREETQSEPSEKTRAYNKFLEVKNEVKEACERFTESRKDVFKDIATGELQAPSEDIAGKALWQCILELGVTVSLEDMAQVWLDINGLLQEEPDDEEVYEDAEKEVFELSFARQCALLLADTYLQYPIDTYNAKLDKKMVEKYRTVDKALLNYGFTPSGLDADIVDEDGELLRILAKRRKEYDSL